MGHPAGLPDTPRPEKARSQGLVGRRPIYCPIRGRRGCNGCTHFLFLEDENKPQSVSPGEGRLARGKKLKGNAKLINALRSAIEATADDDGWAPLGPVGWHLNNQGPFDHRTYGFSKLSDLFAAIDLFEVEKPENGAQPMIRMQRGGA